MAKWCDMTSEQKKKFNEDTKARTYKRKAAALGITVEEYKDRLAMKKKGKTAKEAGLTTFMRVSKVHKVDLTQLIKLVDEPRGSYVPPEDKETPHVLMRQDDDFRVLFRKGDILLARYLRFRPTGTEEECPMYFINLKTRKQFPFVKDKDYAPTDIVKNADAVIWENASITA